MTTKRLHPANNLLMLPRLDSKIITDLLRGNLFPLAYPYPQKMRATRDLLRRRHRYVALRA